MALAGSLGVAVCHGKAEDNHSSKVERAGMIENVLEGKSDIDEMPGWTRQRYEALEKELNELKAMPYLMKEKEAYENARNSESGFLVMLGIGYTLCIAGKLKEKTEEREIRNV